MPKVEISDTKGLVQKTGTGLHLTVDGAVPTVAFAGGSAAGSIGAESTDLAGSIAITTQLASTNTCTVTWAKAYETAPAVVVSGLPNIKAVATTTTLTITGTGNTGIGTICYIAVRSV